jgi:hypothetical protein
MTKKKVIVLIISSLAVVVLGVLLVYYFLSSRLPSNSPQTIGNSAGNLHNGGLFCEYDGSVYFSNTFDHGYLYKMDVNEGHIHKLEDVKINNLLAAGKRLYYYQPSQAGSQGFGFINSPDTFVRCNLNGSGRKEIIRTSVTNAQLIGNDLYLYKNSAADPTLTRITTKGANEKVISSSFMDPSCVADTSFFFSDPEKHFALYAFDTQSNSKRLVTSDLTVWNPIIEGNYIYYMDVTNDYRLCRFSVTDQTVDVLTEDRVDCFNMGYGYIYYQKNSPDDPQLMVMQTDGSNPQVVGLGNFTAIHITSAFVYFQEYGDSDTTYHAQLGVPGYDTFNGAQATAILNE